MSQQALQKSIAELMNGKISEILWSIKAVSYHNMLLKAPGDENPWAFFCCFSSFMHRQCIETFKKSQ